MSNDFMVLITQVSFNQTGKYPETICLITWVTVMYKEQLCNGKKEEIYSRED